MKLFGWLIHGVNILQLMNTYDTLQVAVKVCTLHSRTISPSMQRDSCYGETWWNHWSPKFLKVSIHPMYLSMVIPGTENDWRYRFQIFWAYRFFRPDSLWYLWLMSYFSWEDLTWPAKWLLAFDHRQHVQLEMPWSYPTKYGRPIHGSWVISNHVI